MALGLLAVACAAALAPKPDLSLAPEPEKAPERKAHVSHARSLITLEEINKIYKNGHPSNHLPTAGLIVHMHDDTEEYGAGRLFRPGDRQFQKFWATSVVNENMPGLYKNDCGVIINHNFVELLCSFYQDYTSWNAGCDRDFLYEPDRLEEMLNKSLALQKGGAAGFDGKYNEVLISSKTYRDNLPGSVAAVFYTDVDGNDAQPDCAVNTHKEIVSSYGLEEEQVLLLKHTPGGSPGFVEHDAQAAEAAARALPGGTCVSITDSVEDEWCRSNCAVNNCPETMCKCDEEAVQHRQRLMRGRPTFWWAGATDPRK